MTSITPLFSGTFMVKGPSYQVAAMLLLTAILHVWLPAEPRPNDLLAQVRQRIGHLGLTIIALVFVLLTFWRQ